MGEQFFLEDPPMVDMIFFLTVILLLPFMRGWVLWIVCLFLFMVARSHAIFAIAAIAFPLMLGFHTIQEWYEETQEKRKVFIPEEHATGQFARHPYPDIQ